MSWTDERVALLTRLWNKGYSAAQIAEEFGDITRSAVIGKVHRLGLTGRAAESRFRAARLKVRNNHHPEHPANGVSCGAITSACKSNKGIPYTDLDGNQCRWPLGEINEVATHACGETIFSHPKLKSRLPYCEKHMAVALLESARVKLGLTIDNKTEEPET